MKRAWVLVLLLGIGMGAMGCKHGPSDDECKRLLDHIVDLEFKKAGAAANNDATRAELEKQKAAVSQAKAHDFLATCKAKMSRKRVLCALSANALDGDNGVAKCDEAK